MNQPTRARPFKRRREVDNDALPGWTRTYDWVSAGADDDRDTGIHTSAPSIRHGTYALRHDAAMRRYAQKGPFCVYGSFEEEFFASLYRVRVCNDFQMTAGAGMILGSKASTAPQVTVQRGKAARSSRSLTRCGPETLCACAHLRGC